MLRRASSHLSRRRRGSAPGSARETKSDQAAPPTIAPAATQVSGPSPATSLLIPNAAKVWCLPEQTKLRHIQARAQEHGVSMDKIERDNLRKALTNRSRPSTINNEELDGSPAASAIASTPFRSPGPDGPEGRKGSSNRRPPAIGWSGAARCGCQLAASWSRQRGAAVDGA